MKLQSHLSKKAQSATEFVVLVSFMLIVFFAFFIIIQDRIVDVTRERDRIFLREANALVVDQIRLASQVQGDYSVNFTMPLGEQPYTTQILDGREVVSVFNDLEYVNFLAVNVSGQLIQGVDNDANTIYKTDGVLFYNNTVFIPNYNTSGFFVNVNPESCYVATIDGVCENLNDIHTGYESRCQELSLCLPGQVLELPNGSQAGGGSGSGSGGGGGSYVNTSLSCNTVINQFGNYRLESDITSCSGEYILNVSVDDVFIDCNGYLLSGDATQAIYISGSNVTLYGCNIQSTGDVGVYVDDVDQTTIQQTQIRAQIIGLHFVSAAYAVVENTFVDLDASTVDYGILMTGGSDYSRFDSVNISLQNGDIGAVAFDINGLSSYSNFSNMLINNAVSIGNGITISSASHLQFDGILINPIPGNALLLSSAHNINVTNADFFGSGGPTVYLFNSHSNMFSDFFINASGGARNAISIESTSIPSEYNYFTDGTVYTYMTTLGADVLRVSSNLVRNNVFENVNFDTLHVPFNADNFLSGITSSEHLNITFNNSMGKITWSQLDSDISELGNLSMGREVILADNSLYVNPVNLTSLSTKLLALEFYNPDLTGITTPVAYVNGSECVGCSALVNHGGGVYSYVSSEGFGTYSIGEDT